MSGEFKTIKPQELTDNPFTLIGSDWMLITSGTIDKFNMMTASWGGMGILWGKNVCFVFVRPTRYTYEFMEKQDNFSLSFFGNEWRGALNICGTKSGRDIDKVEATGLIPFKGDNNTVGFEQARLVIECKKLYYQDLTPDNFLDPSIESFYPIKDYHRMYVGEILSVKVK
ncbi:MAG: flavin reductase family protein [Clostridiaceae bacterium]|nr:flavin reductase family protein [Clostridiaceae bacterium]